MPVSHLCRILLGLTAGLLWGFSQSLMPMQNMVPKLLLNLQPAQTMQPMALMKRKLSFMISSAAMQVIDSDSTVGYQFQLSMIM